MYLDLVSIGNHQLDYPQKDESEFSTMPEYIKMARKIIAHFAPKFGTGLAKEMLASEDAVSNVATQLMHGDWRWNEEYKNDKNTKRTKYAYRNQCGIWAIQGYLGRKRKNRGQEMDTRSLDFKPNNTDAIRSMYAVIEDKRQQYELEKVDNEDHQKFANIKLKELLCSGVLTEQQQSFIQMHFLEEKSMGDIAAANKISREAVRQVISRGIYKLQELISHS